MSLKRRLDLSTLEELSDNEILDILTPNDLDADVSDKEDFQPEEPNSLEVESETGTEGEPVAPKRSRTKEQEARGSLLSDRKASPLNVPIAAIPETIIIPTSNLMRDIGSREINWKGRH